MKIEQVPINELKEADYNPRQLTEDQHKHLTESIKRFGLVDPIIINKHKGRENVVIGGHQRLKIARQLAFETVPVVYLDLDLEREKELNLRLNRNLGQWDWEKLANQFDLEFLAEVGFTEKDLQVDLKLNNSSNTDVDESRFGLITVEAPEAPRLKERHAFYCQDIDQYKKICEFFSKDGAKLDVDKLISLI